MSKKPYIRPLDLKQGVIDMNHGAGGRASKQLIDELFAKYFHNPYLGQGDDGARLPSLGEGEQLVMSTDAHVVQPLFFAGGDIGTLAVNGTVNDLAMMGAKPLYLTCSFIIEAGFALADLQRIIQSMATSASIANVIIVAGDTKVVEHGKADGVFISTSGVGVVTAKHQPSGKNAQVGDVVILSGNLADHGIAVLAERESLKFESPIQSDCAALNSVVERLCSALPEGAIKVLRDPTRGGLATTLNEIAEQSQVGILLQEQAIPVGVETNAVCELLGLDPLYIANEGKFIAIVDQQYGELALQTLKSHPLAEQAAIIGEVIEDAQHFIQMQTKIGGLRMVDWLNGEPLPRIC